MTAGNKLVEVVDLRKRVAIVGTLVSTHPLRWQWGVQHGNTIEPCRTETEARVKARALAREGGE